MLQEQLLVELTKAQLLQKSKRDPDISYAPDNQFRGKNRFERRRFSRVSNSVQNYNQMDMNTFFKQDILTVKIDVRGETSNYKAIIKFGGILKELQQEVKRNDNKLEFKLIHRALIDVFNRGDVYMHCSCEDFKYRFNHWSFKNDYAITKGNSDPGPGKGITNPKDTRGAGCKHLLLILANVDWLMKVASTINNYIHYMEEHYERLYADIMFPQIYGMPYEAAIQLDLFDNQRNYLKTGKDTLSKSNVAGKGRTQFQKGNTQGVRFASKPSDETDQFQLDLDMETQDQNIRTELQADAEEE